MDTTKLMKFGVAAAALFAVYKFAPNQAVKAMALGAAGVAVAMQVPYVNAAFTA